MKKLYIYLVSFMLWVPVIVFGGDTGGGQGVSQINTLKNPASKVQSLQDLFKIVIDVMIVFAVPIIVFFIIYAGFMFVTAQGNPEKISKAKSALTWAIVGGLLVLGAWAILTILEMTVKSITG